MYLPTREIIFDVLVIAFFGFAFGLMLREIFVEFSIMTLHGLIVSFAGLIMSIVYTVIEFIEVRDKKR